MNKRIVRIDCGLSVAEMDTIMKQVKNLGLMLAREVELWKQTADPENMVLCWPCVDAVIEAAG